jgi:hypothetical protein
VYLRIVWGGSGRGELSDLLGATAYQVLTRT